MKNTINESDFTTAFHKMGRVNNLYNGNFIESVSHTFYGGRGPWVDSLDFWSYENLKEFENDYGKEFSDIDKRFKYSIEDNTTLIPIEGTDGFIIQAF